MAEAGAPSTLSSLVQAETVAGDPPRSPTEPDTTSDKSLRNYNQLVEMLFDMQMTHGQRAQLRGFIDKYRLSRKPAERQVFDNCMQLYAKLMDMPEQERMAMCRQMRAITLMEQWKLAKTGDAEAQFMLDLYYAAHPPLAQGPPHLTPDIVDALIEFDHFFNTEVKGLKTGPIDQPFREKMYKEAVAKWATLNAQGKEDVLKTASQVSVQRIKWANSGPEDRLMIKANLVGVQNLSPQEKQQLQQIQSMMAQMNAMVQQHQHQMLNNELQFMRQNQQTIMGNGTYYNQTLRRWEQHGGVVTEFH